VAQDNPINDLLDAYLKYQTAKVIQAIKSGESTPNAYLFEMYVAILPNMVEMLHMPLEIASTAFAILAHTAYTDPKYAPVVASIGEFVQGSNETAAKYGIANAELKNIIGSLDQMLQCYNDVKEATDGQAAKEHSSVGESGQEAPAASEV
jgi:hypothetical protein